MPEYRKQKKLTSDFCRLAVSSIILRHSQMDDEIKNFLEKEVVIDTDSRWVYVGTLKKIGKGFLTLKNVDAHDLTETISTRDEYLVNIKTHGLVVNRKTVTVSRKKLIGLSLLKDIRV